MRTDARSVGLVPTNSSTVRHGSLSTQGHPANRSIVDLDLAPRDERGLVVFNADFSMLVPVNLTAGNGRAIVELPNRGRRRLGPVMNMAPP